MMNNNCMDVCSLFPIKCLKAMFLFCLINKIINFLIFSLFFLNIIQSGNIYKMSDELRFHCHKNNHFIEYIIHHSM